MKNKIELKKICICMLAVMLFFLLTLTGIQCCQYQTYTRNYNARLDLILTNLLETYPGLSRNDIISILNQETGQHSNEDSIWSMYGIDLSTDSLILANDIAFYRFLITEIVVSVLFLFLLFAVFLLYQRHRGKQLAEITRYVEELNRRNYKLEISSNTEDELSILKNEIYKTTVLLKESAENSLQDKKNLKNSLSDISHQLKTPLTSILIMLDNILDDPDMNPRTRTDFIQSIKREITNLNFFVGTILKLSRFDANAVHFHVQPVLLSELLDTVAQNVSVLCDLKEVRLQITGTQESSMECDLKWQSEALTNIVKDCIEHSQADSVVEIFYADNKLYCDIIIRDHGTGISAEELPHIFERFYRGTQASQESVGIGLALAKSIIEAGNGRIHASSEPGRGTTFEIRYDKF